MGKRVAPRQIIKIRFCLITCFLLGNFFYAQTTLNGVVKDSLKKPLPSISIVATNVNADTIVGYTYSNSNGEFSLQIQKEGSYLLTFDGLAHTKKSLKIQVDHREKILLDECILYEEETQLDEVLIQYDKPITIKKDTIIFSADAFSRGNEVVVEDLLKNIPGLSVDVNGRISIQGKEVEKVMVDYDDFFDNGYTMLTKNMPSNAIDKVEVLEHYSNNRILKGIEDSEKVALNLTLKENKKNIWFGDLTLGHDISGGNQYETNANIMSFGDNNKYYFLSSLNNTGVDVSGDISYVVSPKRFAEPGTLGNDQKAISFINLTDQDFGLKQERVNFNNVELLSLNSIFNLSPKIKTKVLGLLKTDNNDFYRNGFETYITSEQTFTNTENYRLRKNSINGFGQIDFTYNMSPESMLEYTGKYNKIEEKTNTNLEFNNETTSEFLKNKNTLIDHKVVYSNKLKNSTALVFTGRFIDHRIPQDYKINQFFLDEIFSEIGNVEKVSQMSDNKMQFAGIESHLLGKKANSNLLELKAGYTSRKDILTSQLLLEERNNFSAPENFGNEVTYETNDLYLNSKYVHKFNKLSITGNLDFHLFYNRIAFEARESSSECPFYINPKLKLEWTINSKNKIYYSNSYTITNATILDVPDNFILTGYRSFSKGIGAIDQTDASNFNLGYNLGNWDNLFLVHTSFNYIHSHNYFSNSSIIDPNYTLASKILIKNREMLIGNINIDRYLQRLSTNVKLNLSLINSEYENFVNDKSRNIKYQNYNYGLEFRSGFSGSFNFNFGSTWKFNQIDSEIKTSFTDNVSFLNLNFMVNDNLNMEIDSERYYYGNLSKNENIYYFLDFNARYNLDKKRLSFSIQGRNLFNTNTFKSYSITDISISSTEYRLLPRYVLLKATYKF